MRSVKKPVFVNLSVCRLTCNVLRQAGCFREANNNRRIQAGCDASDLGRSRIISLRSILGPFHDLPPSLWCDALRRASHRTMGWRHGAVV